MLDLPVEYQKTHNADHQCPHKETKNSNNMNRIKQHIEHHQDREHYNLNNLKQCLMDTIRYLYKEHQQNHFQRLQYYDR